MFSTHSIKRLKQRFGYDINDLNPTEFTCYTNLLSCPYAVARHKMAKTFDSFVLVNELKNIFFLGVKQGERVVIVTTMYLNGKF